MALIDYSSSEDEVESQKQPSPVLPSFSYDIEGDPIRFLETDRSYKPDGRIRGFPHQHGNWATSVYVPATEALESFLYGLLDNVNSMLTQYKEEFHICDDFHLSLSRTWPILHHWIAGFENTLGSIAVKYARPIIKLEKAEFLVNDEGTRSFLVVCTEKSDFLINLLGDIDPIVASYRGAPYYKVSWRLEFHVLGVFQDQIFHFSLSWCLGDINKAVLRDWKEACLMAVNNFLSSHSPAEGFELTSLVLKTGDKIHQFPFRNSSCLESIQT